LLAGKVVRFEYERMMLGDSKILFFFGFKETSPPRKAHFVGLDEGIKPRLSQALTRGAHPDSKIPYRIK